jgi:hypothetical protein
MRLIEIAALVDGVGDRGASLQESRGLLGALDLADAALGQPGGPQEAVPHRPGCQPLQSASQHSVHERVANKHPVAHEPVDERLRVLVIGIFPRGPF